MNGREDLGKLIWGLWGWVPTRSDADAYLNQTVYGTFASLLREKEETDVIARPITPSDGRAWELKPSMMIQALADPDSRSKFWQKEYSLFINWRATLASSASCNENAYLVGEGIPKKLTECQDKRRSQALQIQQV